MSDIGNDIGRFVEQGVLPRIVALLLVAGLLAVPAGFHRRALPMTTFGFDRCAYVTFTAVGADVRGAGGDECTPFID